MLLICGLAENAPLWSQRHEYIGHWQGKGRGRKFMITRLELRDMDTFTLGRLRKEGLGICGSNSNGNGRRRIIGGSASGNSGPAVRVGVLQLRESVAKQRKEWVEISNLEELQVVDKVAVQCKDTQELAGVPCMTPTNGLASTLCEFK